MFFIKNKCVIEIADIYLVYVHEGLKTESIINTGTEDERKSKRGRLANCDSLIQRMEHGYDTVIGENGNMLSGGERQRLSVAEPLCKKVRLFY